LNDYFHPEYSGNNLPKKVFLAFRAAVNCPLGVFPKQRKPYLLLRPCDPIVAPV